MFPDYGLSYECRRAFTFDHLVPVELGTEQFGVIDDRWDLLYLSLR